MKGKPKRETGLSAKEMNDLVTYIQSQDFGGSYSSRQVVLRNDLEDKATSRQLYRAYVKAGYSKREAEEMIEER